jgi:hypothetical protein
MKEKNKTTLYNKVFCRVLDNFIKHDLKDSIILNESDMKSLLYCRLLEQKIFRDPIKRSKKYQHRMNLLHTEYYRTETKESKKGTKGRWDIAILYPDAYPEPWVAKSDKNANYHDRRPIMIGCELKYKYYRNPGKDWELMTMKEINGDASVFSGEYPEYGWVVYVDVRENSKTMMTKKQQNMLCEKIRDIKNKLSHIYFRYIEYNEETGKYKVIKI